jgi:hypothetical protein
MDEGLETSDDVLMDAEVTGGTGDAGGKRRGVGTKSETRGASRRRDRLLAHLPSRLRACWTPGRYSLLKNFFVRAGHLHRMSVILEYVTACVSLNIVFVTRKRYRR